MYMYMEGLYAYNIIQCYDFYYHTAHNYTCNYILCLVYMLLILELFV